MRTIAFAIALTALALPALAGSLDRDSSSTRRDSYTIRDNVGRTTARVTPLYSGSSTYQLRDKAGRLQGSARPLYEGSDQLVIRDRTGRMMGTIKQD